MPRRAQWALRISTALLFLAGYLALASVQAFGQPLLLAAVLVLAVSTLGERLDKASPGYRMITTAISIAYFCFIPVTVLWLGLLPAVIALIIYIQFHTMLHQKEEKSYYHIFLMSFFLLLAACTQAPEASIGLVLVLFLGATIWAFFSLRVAFEAEESQVRVPADIVRFGEEPTKQIHDGRDPFDLGVAAYLFLVVLMAVGITVGIFFSTPRVEAGAFGRSSAPIIMTGVPDRIKLVSGRTIEQDFTPALRVEFPDSPHGHVTVFPLYWRINTLAKFSDNGWDHASLDGTGDARITDKNRTGWHVDLTDLQRKRRPDAQVEHQIIYMDEVPSTGMPALDLVQRVLLSTDTRGMKLSWSDMNDFAVILTSTGQRQLRYEAWSEVDQPSPIELRADNGGTEGLGEDDATVLTEQSLLPETIALVNKVTASAQSNYDKIDALKNYLSSNTYKYSRNVPALPAEFAIDAFINQVRTGHCELFATALALMVRSLGIPARVVTGYKGGEINESDGSYLVRRAMAHLWVEAYFPEHGWVRFDPSPPSDPNDSPGVFSRIGMAASLYALKARMLWFNNIVGYRGWRMIDFNELRLRVFGEMRYLQARASDAIATDELSRLFVGGAFTVGAVMLLAWLVYRSMSDAASLRRSSLGHYVLSRDQRRAITVYRGVRKKLQGLGIDTAGKTAEELLQDLGASDWPQRSEAQALLAAYNEVRFGGRPLPGERLAQLVRALRALKPRQRGAAT